MKTIGIVCEGPTDYVILQGVIDGITSEKNRYMPIQPEPDACGRYMNGWKGVLKWCGEHAGILPQYMKDMQPALDLLVVQLDGDVSRKDKPVHCGCGCVQCERRGIDNPLSCDANTCPVALPCLEHGPPVGGYITHLKGLVGSLLGQVDSICIAIPCDSIEAWIVAAYDGMENVEAEKDPWEHIIARGKYYHDIRVVGKKKRALTFLEFVPVVRENWSRVTQLCESARDFEENVRRQLM